MSPQRRRSARTSRASGKTARPPATLVILGASGDLTSRLLLPGLGTLLQHETDRRVRVVGASNEALTPAAWKRVVRTAFRGVGAEAANCVDALESTHYVQLDVTDPEQLSALLGSLDVAADGQLALYFALPPAVAAAACATLRDVALPPQTILALEKPFGTSESSARALNRVVTALVPEQQVFRIDHFLGLYTLLNVFGLRFANRLMEPIWSAEHIERIEICYDEQIALEGRAGYYDHNGALRDMIQSHLLQVLAVLTMEPAASLGAEDLRNAKAQALRAIRLKGDDPVVASRRARYTKGTIGRRAVPSYVNEPGVDSANHTETLAEVELEVDNARWAGVPITLRSGKALGRARKRAVLYLRPVRHLPTGFTGAAVADRLVIDFRPDTLELTLTTNGGDDPFSLEQSTLTTSLGGSDLEPYGQVLAHVLDGDPRLAVRGDAAEECWRIVAPVLKAWAEDKVPLQTYRAGSDGPSSWASSHD